jgi:hypothetical protein
MMSRRQRVAASILWHLNLDDGYATTAACDALNTWWDQAYGGVATRRERQ